MFIPFHDENPTTHYPVVTYLLVALNVLVFIASRQLSERDWQLLVYRWGFIPARIAQLKTHQPVVVHVQEVVKSPIFGPVEVRRPLQLKAQPGKILFSLITCMFLHGGWLHLIFNMWFLLLFGNSVEDRLGPLLFLVLFFGGGLIAGASQWLVEPRSMIPMIGA
ncbi:MAG: rhomboid family intramembrane serine protease, partial [Thermoguttaceae bacterium]